MELEAYGGGEGVGEPVETREMLSVPLKRGVMLPPTRLARETPGTVDRTVGSTGVIGGWRCSDCRLLLLLAG